MKPFPPPAVPFVVLAKQRERRREKVMVWAWFVSSLMFGLWQGHWAAGFWWFATVLVVDELMDRRPKQQRLQDYAEEEGLE